VYAENEAEPIVDWLGGLSIPATVLRYPLNARHPVPLDAVRSEVHRLRATGTARVGAVGFSAGGHLAGQAALSDASSPETRIDLAILGYAITSMEMETYRPAAAPVSLGLDGAGRGVAHRTARPCHTRRLQ
jgi:acetyl esterase/lipase